jgi:hypothetical protein
VRSNFLIFQLLVFDQHLFFVTHNTPDTFESQYIQHCACNDAKFARSYFLLNGQFVSKPLNDEEGNQSLSLSHSIS